jgi:hypothetical protein
MAYVQGFTKRAKDLMASPNIDATTTAFESLPSDNMLSSLQKMVPPTSVCITMSKQKNFVGTLSRLHVLKPILMIYQVN